MCPNHGSQGKMSRKYTVNFSPNFERINEPSESGVSVFSDIFMPSHGWLVQLYANGDSVENVGFLSVYLHVIFPDQLQSCTVEFCFSVLDCYGIQHWMKRSSVVRFTKDQKALGFPRFVSRKTLMNNPSLYLPSNNLKLNCELTVTAQNCLPSTQPINYPIPQPIPPIGTYVQNNSSKNSILTLAAAAKSLNTTPTTAVASVNSGYDSNNNANHKNYPIMQSLLKPTDSSSSNFTSIATKPYYNYSSDPVFQIVIPNSAYMIPSTSSIKCDYTNSNNINNHLTNNSSSLSIRMNNNINQNSNFQITPSDNQQSYYCSPQLFNAALYEHTWSVGVFHSLPSENDLAIKSPRFVYRSLAWHFEIYPNGRGVQNRGYLSVLLRTHPLKNVNLRAKLILSLVQPRTGTRFCNFVWDNFQPSSVKSELYGHLKFISREILMGQYGWLLPDGKLTMHCQIIDYPLHAIAYIYPIPGLQPMHRCLNELEHFWEIENFNTLCLSPDYDRLTSPVYEIKEPQSFWSVELFCNSYNPENTLGLSLRIRLDYAPQPLLLSWSFAICVPGFNAKWYKTKKMVQTYGLGTDCAACFLISREDLMKWHHELLPNGKLTIYIHARVKRDDEVVSESEEDGGENEPEVEDEPEDEEDPEDGEEPEDENEPENEEELEDEEKPEDEYEAENDQEVIQDFVNVIDTNSNKGNKRDFSKSAEDDGKFPQDNNGIVAKRFKFY